MPLFSKTKYPDFRRIKPTRFYSFLRRYISLMREKSNMIIERSDKTNIHEEIILKTENLHSIFILTYGIPHSNICL